MTATSSGILAQVSRAVRATLRDAREIEEEATEHLARKEADLVDLVFDAMQRGQPLQLRSGTVAVRGPGDPRGRGPRHSRRRRRRPDRRAPQRRGRAVDRRPGAGNGPEPAQPGPGVASTTAWRGWRRRAGRWSSAARPYRRRGAGCRSSARDHLVLRGRGSQHVVSPGRRRLHHSPVLTASSSSSVSTSPGVTTLASMRLIDVLTPEQELAGAGQAMGCEHPVLDEPDHRLGGARAVTGPPGRY